MEYLDIRYRDGSLTGQKRARKRVHSDGDLHGTAHVFIMKKDNAGKNYILLQKRSKDKDAYPGCYDISSAGHVPSGENYLDAALREMKEELGICAKAEELKFLGFHEGYSEEVFYGEAFRNHEISKVYLYENAVDISLLNLQEEEVESVKWMDFDTCYEDVKSGSKAYCLFTKELDMIRETL